MPTVRILNTLHFEQSRNREDWLRRLEQLGYWRESEVQPSKEHLIYLSLKEDADGGYPAFRPAAARRLSRTTVLVRHSAAEQFLLRWPEAVASRRHPTDLAKSFPVPQHQSTRANPDSISVEPTRRQLLLFIMDLPTFFILNNGTTVPALGLGTFQGEEGNAKVKEAVKLALKLGYRHIDGANAYGNEKEIGEGIKESGVPRSEIYVTSKL
jgi:hypothetical protein